LRQLRAETDPHARRVQRRHEEVAQERLRHLFSVSNSIDVGFPVHDPETLADLSRMEARLDEAERRAAALDDRVQTPQLANRPSGASGTGAVSSEPGQGPPTSHAATAVAAVPSSAPQPATGLTIGAAQLDAALAAFRRSAEAMSSEQPDVHQMLSHAAELERRMEEMTSINTAERARRQTDRNRRAGIALHGVGTTAPQAQAPAPISADMFSSAISSAMSSLAAARQPQQVPPSLSQSLSTYVSLCLSVCGWMLVRSSFEHVCVYGVACLLLTSLPSQQPLHMPDDWQSVLGSREMWK
jgi:hypothetical protein